MPAIPNFEVDFDIYLNFGRRGLVTVYRRALTEMVRVMVRTLNHERKTRTPTQIKETCRYIANDMGSVFANENWLTTDTSTHTAPNMERLRNKLRDDSDADRKNFFVENASIDELKTMCGNVSVMLSPGSALTEEIEDPLARFCTGL